MGQRCLWPLDHRLPWSLLHATTRASAFAPDLLLWLAHGSLQAPYGLYRHRWTAIAHLTFFPAKSIITSALRPTNGRHFL